MEHRLSKLSLTLIAAGLGLSASTVSYAGQNNRQPVTVPCSQAHYYVGITGLWAQATNDDLTYARTGDLSARHFHVIEHDHDFGWRLDGAFEINGFGNDVAANYTYLSSCGDNSASINNSQTSSGNIEARFVNDNNWATVTGESEFKFHEFNLELGQKVEFCQLHTRFHMGLSFAKVEHDITAKTSRYNTTAGDEGRYVRERGAANVCSTFSGVGPRVGLDVTYPVAPCSNFAVVGHVAGALLAGKLEHDVKSHTQEYDSSGQASSSADFSNRKADDQYTVIPAGTLKLGLRYASGAAEAGACGWAAEAGFQTTGYVHAVANQVGYGDRNSSSASNYGNYGFYLTLSYAG